MKKFFGIVLTILILSLVLSSCDEMTVPPPTAVESGQTAKDASMDKLIRSVPVPVVQTAQERKAVARRVETFDKENKIGYVYVMCPGVGIVGYYTCIGKVASLNSYLVPQERLTDEKTYRRSDGSYDTTHVSGYYVMDDADIDGTYGHNVEGVFFFTDNDTYVELPAATPYIYSDQPLPLKAVKLNGDKR